MHYFLPETLKVDLSWSLNISKILPHQEESKFQPIIIQFQPTSVPSPAGSHPNKTRGPKVVPTKQKKFTTQQPPPRWVKIKYPRHVFSTKLLNLIQSRTRHMTMVAIFQLEYKATSRQKYIQEIWNFLELVYTIPGMSPSQQIWERYIIQNRKYHNIRLFSVRMQGNKQVGGHII